MITYKLTKQSMLDYLNGKLTIRNQQLVEQQTTLDAAVAQYKVDLDAVGSYLRYELFDPEATLIVELVNAIKADLSNEYCTLSLTFFKWTNQSVYINKLGELVSLYDLDNQLIAKVRRVLTKELSLVDESLLDADMDYFNYYNDKSGLFDLCSNSFNSLATTAKRSRNEASNAINALRQTRCLINSITNELNLTEFSESAEFTLTSECKL